MEPSEPRPVDLRRIAGPGELTAQAAPLSEAEFGGPGLLQVVWQRRWIVLGVTILALAGGVVYIATSTPIYESTSRIQVEKQGPAIISRDEGMIMTESRNYVYTQAEVLQSRRILDNALKLMKAPEGIPLPPLKTFENVDDPVLFLKTHCLDVEVGKKDEIITVSARSPYPKEATIIVNTVVQAYRAFHLESKQETVGTIQEMLQKEKKDREQDLNAKIDAIVELKKNAGILLFESGEQNLVVRRLAQLWDQLDQAKSELTDAKAAHEGIQASTQGSTSALPLGVLPESVLAQFYTTDREYERAIRDLRKDIHEAEEELRGLRAQYTAEVPTVDEAAAHAERLAKDLKVLEEERARQRASFLEASRAAAEYRYLTARKKVEDLESEAKKYTDEALDAQVKQAEFAKLESEMKRSENFNAILDERIKEFSVSSREDRPLNISILDFGRVEDIPVAPKKAQTMAIALVLGLMLGVGLAFLRDQLDQRLRSSDEMAAVLGAPVLGVLPHIKTARELSRTGQYVHLRPQSPDAEAYRTIRTAIYYTALNRSIKTLLITSPASGDGKTTVASNLAIAMAQLGQHVLILDADLRRPSQHRVFPVNGEAPEHVATLADVLQGQESVDRLIQPTEIQGLDVLPCLSRVPNPVEVLNSAQFATLLRNLADRYDRVVVDSPPVMPVADARVLGTLCDATIVVLRAEKSGRKVTDLTREALTSVGTHILGAAVNDVPKGKGGHGHYGYYGVPRKYGYGSYHHDGDDGEEGGPLT